MSIRMFLGRQITSNQICFVFKTPSQANFGHVKAAERKFGRKFTPIVSIFFRITAPQPPRALPTTGIGTSNIHKSGRFATNTRHSNLEFERQHLPRSRAELRLVQVGIVPDWRSRARPDRHPGTHSICADHNRDAFPIAGYSWKEPKQMQMLPRPPAEAGPETARNALVAPRGPVDAGSWNLKTAKARPCPARSHCPLCWPGKNRPKPGLLPSPQRRPLRPPS